MKFPLKRILSFLIFLTIVFSPLYIVRWTWFGVLPTTLLEILIGVTTLVWLLYKFHSRTSLYLDRKFVIPIILFLLASFLSVYVSSDTRGGLGILKAYILEPIIFFVILVDTRSDENLEEKIIKALFIAGCLLAGVCLSQALIKWPIFAPHEMAAGRVHGVFNSANALGLFLGPIVFLVLSRRKNIFYYLMLGLLVLVILLSKSSGALIGLIGGFFLFLILSIFPFTRSQHYIFTLSTLTVLVLGTLFFLSQVSRFTSQVDNPWVRTGGTAQIRFCVWEGTRNLLSEKPIFGAGLSGFKELYSQKYYTCDAEPLEYPHNWILNFWAELGLFGIVSFLWLLVLFFLNLSCIKNNYSSSLSAAMFYWLIHGLVDVPVLKNDLALEFWVLMALGVILASRKNLRRSR